MIRGLRCVIWILSFTFGGAGFAELPEGLKERIPDNARYDRLMSVGGPKGVYGVRSDGGALLLNVLQAVLGKYGFYIGMDFNAGAHFASSSEKAALVVYSGPALGWKHDFWDRRISFLGQTAAGPLFSFANSSAADSGYFVEPTVAFQVRVSKVVRVGVASGYVISPSSLGMNGIHFGLQVKVGREMLFWYSDT